MKSSCPFSLTPTEDLVVQTLIKTGSAELVAKALNRSYYTIRDQLEVARVKAKVPNRIRLVVAYLEEINKE